MSVRGDFTLCEDCGDEFVSMFGMYRCLACLTDLGHPEEEEAADAET